MKAIFSRSALAGAAFLISAAAAAAQNCQTISDAIAKLPAEGGTVKIPAGEYLCENPVVIDRDNITLTGAGSGRTILRAKDATPLPVLIIGSIRNVVAEHPNKNFEAGVPYPDRVTKNVQVSGLTVDGNYHSHPDPGSVECWNPQTHSSRDCTDDTGVSVRNNGISIRRAENIVIRDVITKSNYSGGVVTEKHCKNLVFENFESSDNWYDGFAGYLTIDSVIRGFKVTKNRAAGISIDGSFMNNVFEDGVVSENGDYGVFSNEIKQNTYRRLKVIDNGNSGFYFDGIRYKSKRAKPASCDGQRIVDTEISGKKEGIFVAFPCKNVQLENVTIIQPEKKCLKMSRGAEVIASGATSCGDGVPGSNAEALSGTIR